MRNAFVVAPDGKGVVGLGIKSQRNKGTAITCAGGQAKAEMFHISSNSFDPECSEQHKIPQQLFDYYGDLKVTLNTVARDTGIESSPLARFPLHLIGIKNCVVTPESSMIIYYLFLMVLDKFFNSASFALAIFNALGKNLQTK